MRNDKHDHHDPECGRGDALRPQGLLCEYAENPLGIDCLAPRFSWKLSGGGREGRQAAYQLLVASSQALICQNRADMWDSGKTEGRESVHVVYQGRALSSGQRCFWKVRTWGHDGREPVDSEPAWFEMGLLNPDDWQAEWIGSPHMWSRSPMIRKEFALATGVRKARAYISGLGYYELRINGKKIGDHVLDPAWTDYTKRILYATYDVTEHVRCGRNVIGVMLGEGWFRPVFQNNIDPIPQMILRLSVELEDGRTVAVTSRGADAGWLIYVKQGATSNNCGPIVANSVYNGETYDARMEVPGWDEVGAQEGQVPGGAECWESVITLEPPGGRLMCQSLEPITVVGDVAPLGVTNPKPGIHVFDFGRNMAGWAKLKVRGPAGTQVVMRFAEMLGEDGTVNQENLRTANQQDVYLLKGIGSETYEPRFTYHGFRYAQVEGYPGTPDADAVTARVVRSAVKPSGSFRCSDALINTIQEIAVRTEASNLHGLPTDCPQRDERLGWLNDMTVRAEEGVYNFNMARLYAKWMHDIADTQGASTGAIADTAPFYRYGRRPADPVCSSYLLVPWLLYLHYGDRRALEEHYEGLRRWVAYLGTQTDGGIIHYSTYGDWASPLGQSADKTPVSGITPGALMSTGFYCYNAMLMAKISLALGKRQEADGYRALGEQVREAFNRVFLDRRTGQYAGGSQAANTFALYLGLVPDECRRQTLANLIADIVDKHQCHLTTGNLCSRFIYDVLADAGRLDVAYALLTQTTYPSLGYMIANGATTLWERWEHVTTGHLCSMGSHNHPMYGSVSAWLYTTLAGILPDERGPGFARMVIKPQLPDRLEFVECSLDTVAGRVESSWRRERGRVELNVAIPANSAASVFVPKAARGRPALVSAGGVVVWQDGARRGAVPGVEGGVEFEGHVRFEVGPGRYTFTSG